MNVKGPENIRVFIAIDLPEKLKQSLESLNIAHPKLIRYIPANFHITLKFIGAVSKEKIEEIKERLSSIKFSPFPLSISTLGYFYPHKRGTPIWIGIENNVELIELQRKLDKILQGMDLKLDKIKFLPHLTLGRMEKVVSEEDIQKFLRSQKIPKFSFTVKEFTLFHSHSTDNGVEYLPLGRFPAVNLF